MRKKSICFLSGILILIGAVTALCNEGVFGEITEECTEVTQCEEDLRLGFEEDDFEKFFVESVKNVFDDVCTIISENDVELYDGMKIKSNFIATALNYGMNSEELNYIKNLFEEGYDMEKILEVYEFIRWTNCDIDVIAGIYDVGIANCDEENWIYEAYDKFFDRTDDILSVEDIAYYVESGISVEEIIGVYELSFAGVKTTKQMLAERLSDENWNTIAASSLSKTPETVINAPEMSMDEIMEFRNISVRLRKDFVEIADVKGEHVEINEETRLSERARILEKDRLMLEYNVTPIQNEKTEKRKAEYATDRPYEINDDAREEDCIPVEEPEVE